LLSIKPLLSAERDVMTPAEQVQLVGARANLMAAQTVAAGDVERGIAEVEGAQIAFDRATQLLADRAGARRAVDDAEALLNVAKANLAAAKERVSQLNDLLKMLEVQTPDGEATLLPMPTPIGGLVNRIDVSVGQTVSAGAILFEVVNLDTIWIRVPVFVDQLSDVQQDIEARLVSLSGASMATHPSAKPVAAPPTADTMSSSADLYYEVDNRELGLRPGQRIGVELPMSKSASSLIVPGGAILYDVYGNTWVYMETGERQYTRRRVAIRFVDGDEVILSAGPDIGTPIVVDGAAELFGTEFGAGK
jgi:RND family efflux transporter MFP subunit